MVNDNNKTDKKHTVLIVTTVPETLATILVGQPYYLSHFFNISLATSPGDFVHEIEKRENVSVSLVPMTRGINPLKDILSIIKMIAFILSLKPDLVHSYTPKAGLVTMLSSWICRVPVRVHTFTGLIFPTSSGIKKAILILIDKLICFCATHIIPEGYGVKSDLMRYQITRKTLNLLGHGNIAGVNTTHYSRNALNITFASNAVKNQLNITDDNFVFCFVGRLNADKGIKELIEAFELQPSSCILLIIGEYDRTSPIDAKLLSKINTNSRIHTLGFLNDIRPILYLTDVIVLPSYREGFPNVLLQASSMEVPIISTDINGCNEITIPNVNGWLVPPRNMFALSSCMYEASLTPKVKLRAMGSSGRKIVENNYEQIDHWNRIVDYYNQLLLNIKQ